MTVSRTFLGSLDFKPLSLSSIDSLSVKINMKYDICLNHHISNTLSTYNSYLPLLYYKLKSRHLPELFLDMPHHYIAVIPNKLPNALCNFKHTNFTAHIQR